MKKVLIASVGGSPEPIMNAIIHAKPEFIYFLCSAGKVGSDTMVEQTIVPSAKLSIESYVIERVSSPNELRDVVAACARIESDLDTRFAGDEVSVIANYTGGTRTMSAGLVALAQRRGWDAEWTERTAKAWSGPVSALHLAHVTVFTGIDFAFSQNINVIIGENGTGKTHVLKCIYALLRAAEEAESGAPIVTPRSDKIDGVFTGRLRSLSADEDSRSCIRVECADTQFERKEMKHGSASWLLPAQVRVRALFLPSREVLAMYRGFVKAYEDRVLSFDETYYDLCKELSQLEMRVPSSAFLPVLEELEGIIGGPVRLDVDSFVVDTKQGPIPAPMIAEGHRKLACLATLIKNGALTEESCLFWDEPEANLNPKLVRVVARVIRTLAKAGVQIFVATHDYLLARELSLEAEYHPNDVDTRFFALYRPSEDGPVEVESGASWSDLQQNPIFEAYAAHYDRERTLFSGDPPEEEP